MSEQNRYQISHNYQNEREGWAGWIEYEVLSADNWQDAIHEWLDLVWGTGGVYTVVAENPSEDSRSGITEIQFDPPKRFWLGVKIKATLIED